MPSVLLLVACMLLFIAGRDACDNDNVTLAEYNDQKRGIKLTNLYNIFFAYPCDAWNAQPKWKQEAYTKKIISRKRILSLVSFNFIHASRHSGRQCDAHNHSTVEINGFDMNLFTQRKTLFCKNERNGGKKFILSNELQIPFNKHIFFPRFSINFFSVWFLFEVVMHNRNTHLDWPIGLQLQILGKKNERFFWSLTSTLNGISTDVSH